MKSDGDSMDDTSEGLVRRRIKFDANLRLFVLFLPYQIFEGLSSAEPLGSLDAACVNRPFKPINTNKFQFL